MHKLDMLTQHQRIGWIFQYSVGARGSSSHRSRTFYCEALNWKSCRKALDRWWTCKNCIWSSTETTWEQRLWWPGKFLVRWHSPYCNYDMKSKDWKMPASKATFSRMRSEGSRFTLGVWGQGCVRPICVCSRNRPQPSPTVCVRAVRLSTGASASGVVPKVCQVDSCRRSFIGICRGGVWSATPLL